MFTLNKKSIIGCAALLMALAACSDNEDKPITIMGGASEETEIIANQDTSTTDNQDTSSTNNQDTTAFQKVVHFKPTLQENSTEHSSIAGSQYPDHALMYELDPKNLTPTGKVVASFSRNIQEKNLGEESIFQFDSIPFESPYVLIELEYRNSNHIEITAKQAIVDMRDTGDIYINTLTHITSARLQDVYSAGSYRQIRDIHHDSVSFTELKHMVEEELLDAVGFKDYFHDFEKRETFNDSTHIYVEQLLSQIIRDDDFILSTYLSCYGSFEKDFSSIFDKLFRDFEDFEKMNPELIEHEGQKALDYYAQKQIKNQIKVNALATIYGAGGCTSANEGDTLRNIKNNLLIVCDGESWKLIRQPIPHTFDSLVDSRDGNVYKTVTFNMGDVSQTWMAENLAYKAESSTCSEEVVFGRTDDPFYCRFYGYKYPSSTIYGFDSSYSRTPTTEECFAYYQDPDESIDTAAFLSECKSKNTLIDWNKVISDSSLTTQGICPDGWRIPSYEDWEKLIEHVRKTYDYKEEVRYSHDQIIEGFAPYFYSSFGDPTGFNLRYIGAPRIMSNDNYRVFYSLRYDNFWGFAMWPRNAENKGFYAVETFFVGEVYPIILEKSTESVDYEWQYMLTDVNSFATYVRCIKND